jgi:predicted dehydrogenase
VTAVSTTRTETARATARAFGVPLAFDDDARLIECPDVDVVAVTVKVTEHDALVRAALAAGKHVFCEWPLGTNLAQASALADLAAASGGSHVVGLQGHHSPGARYVGELISQGAIGRPLAVSAVAVGRQGGGRIPAASAYTTDSAAGASVARFASLPAGVPPGPPRNVALAYRALPRAIAEDRQAAPGFETAVGYHRLLDAIEQASRTGVRQDVPS